MSAQLFGGLMGKQKRPHSAPDFRLEAAQLTVFKEAGKKNLAKPWPTLLPRAAFAV